MEAISGSPGGLAYLPPPSLIPLFLYFLLSSSLAFCVVPFTTKSGSVIDVYLQTITLHLAPSCVSHPRPRPSRAHTRRADPHPRTPAGGFQSLGGRERWPYRQRRSCELAEKQIWDRPRLFNHTSKELLACVDGRGGGRETVTAGASGSDGKGEAKWGVKRTGKWRGR
ncbi:hypothetical protein E2C01_058609 [Portunus trituberculatus]|uniref:Uncharacterized protein n=1 Tax=Portunus trituberculatus TaxID=210409 RepID=A0A5B7H0A6_PORTR|nr:hypothetical protein [Portunus trituberculatus]